MSPSKDSLEPSAVTLHLAYAEASVMLIESLMRLLIEREVLPVEQVVETIETTIETKRLLAAEGNHAELSAMAAGLLSTIANSIAAGGARGRGGKAGAPPTSGSTE
jgi:hypothetical protein